MKPQKHAPHLPAHDPKVRAARSRKHIAAAGLQELPRRDAGTVHAKRRFPLPPPA
jgi:hypothetical protein